MKNDISMTSIKDYATKAKDAVIKYRHILFALLVAGVLGFMFLRIANMSTAEPENYQVEEAKTIQALKLNEDSIDIILSLQDRNISIEALFDPGRYDPFND